MASMPTAENLPTELEPLAWIGYGDGAFELVVPGLAAPRDSIRDLALIEIGNQGERVKDYPQTSLRLPPETKAKLFALARVSHTPQWRVVSAAVECFFRERSAAERRTVIRYMGEGEARSRRRSPKRTR